MEGGKTWVPSNPVPNPIAALHFGQRLVPVGPAGALVFADRIIAVAGFDEGDPQIGLGQGIGRPAPVAGNALPRFMLGQILAQLLYGSRFSHRVGMVERGQNLIGKSPCHLGKIVSGQGIRRICATVHRCHVLVSYTRVLCPDTLGRAR